MVIKDIDKMDVFHMTSAWLLSQYSQCASKKVGAIIVKDNRVVSSGCNGTKTGYVNCCDYARSEGWLKEQDGIEYLKEDCRQLHREWSAKYEYHAEQNALDSALRNNISIQGATIFINISPCIECCKRLSNVGISKIIFSESYDRTCNDWIKYLNDVGVEVEQLPLSKLKEEIGHMVNFDSVKWDYVIDK